MDFNKVLPVFKLFHSIGINIVIEILLKI